MNTLFPAENKIDSAFVADVACYLYAIKISMIRTLCKTIAFRMWRNIPALLAYAPMSAAYAITCAT